MSATLPSTSCPVCKYEMDAATCLEKSYLGQPRPADISLCLKCGEILIYTDELALRAAELNDLMNLPAVTDALLTRGQMLIRKTRPIV